MLLVYSRIGTRATPFLRHIVWPRRALPATKSRATWWGHAARHLVNPLGHSTDVGFGFERLMQVIEGRSRVDESSLFDQGLHPVVRDHLRTLQVLLEHGILPGPKGRNYVCRRICRRLIRHSPDLSGHPEVRGLIGHESKLMEGQQRLGRRMWRRQKDQPPEWWWNTVGLLPEDLEQLRAGRGGPLEQKT